MSYYKRNIACLCINKLVIGWFPRKNKDLRLTPSIFIFLVNQPITSLLMHSQAIFLFYSLDTAKYDLK